MTYTIQVKDGRYLSLEHEPGSLKNAVLFANINEALRYLERYCIDGIVVPFKEPK